MKIKADFVTNSSSSSFVLFDTTVAEVAIEMLKILRDDSMSVDSEYIDEGIDLIKDNLDVDGIYFPWTCNYDTYIFVEKDWVKKMKGGKRVCVQTSNNHDWEGLGDDWVDVPVDKSVLYLDVNRKEMIPGEQLPD